ncbi:patatin-like phospholipase family protein [Candidatus Nitrotoga sp. 1052]|uniref:patatin-like phospholipase family protein n=1 Tax=Candidatus Nitrotoga sp. 1052 TaxID=2886964 RepID=UPI001EF74CF8|nr:patatin-like phospholipase family protein [Candidatus Nitrotoga sp. 1052]CAH1077717.1 NTE family protein [Candidatus Nitrotoga sp. 1052]
MNAPEKLGLILTGGGARVAYQVGVLKAIAEFLPRHAHNPFPIICGTSSGSLNAVTLAVNARSFRKGVQYLLNIWKNSHVEHVYRTDPVGVLKNSSRWFAGLILSSMGINKLNQVSLLDNAPMVAMLEATLPYEKIQENIDAGHLHALSITASGYGSGCSVTFYQGVEEIPPWKRAHRLGIPTKIEPKHLLASSAIPFIFPAVLLNREYFGDGSMRQIAPISSALHLGATRVLIIGLGHSEEEQNRSNVCDYPSLAQIAGHVMDSIFLDSLEVDVERLQRINHSIGMLTEDAQQQINWRHVDVLVIEPSQAIEQIAQRYAMHLPWTIRFLLRGIGAMRRSGANLVSYLLFEKNFCRAMIELGYQDALKQKQEILAFINQRGKAAESLPQ